MVTEVETASTGTDIATKAGAPYNAPKSIVRMANPTGLSTPGRATDR
jgi:hypothetical protein